MKRVEMPQNPDNFNKGAGVYRYDDKDDELMMYCLDLYPKESARFFGKGNEIKKKMLQEKLRQAMNKAQEEQEMLNASGARKFFKGLGRGVARAALVAPRGAAIGLIRLNYRGAATRLSILNQRGKSKVDSKWKDLGGKTDKLNAAISAGKNKKPLICGKKCRARMGRSQNFDGMDDYYNFSDPVTASMIAAGAGMLSTIIGVISKNQDYKRQEDLIKLQSELQKAENEENAIDATMTPSERKLADEIIRAQNAEADPIEAIRRNPNLTADEKEAAIKELQRMTSSVSLRNKLIIGGIIVTILGLVGYYIYSKKTN